MNVCFLGVGEGREAVKVSKMGAHLTVVDTSKSMLDKFQQKLDKVNLNHEADIYHGNVSEFYKNCIDHYDLVVGNFFLNVFPEHKMPEVLDGLLGLCGEEGKVVIGDFWNNRESSRLVQWLQHANWNVALTIFRLLADNPIHPIYVYDELLEKYGFKVMREKTFNVLGIPMYRSIVAEKFFKQ